MTQKKPKKQTLYLMVNVPFILLWKIGISNSAQAHRQHQVSRAAPGRAVLVCEWKCLNAKAWEGFFHVICAFLNVRYYKGDGYREWFFFPAAIICAVVMSLRWLIVTLLIGFGGIVLLKFIFGL